MKKSLTKDNLFTYILILVTFVALTISGIVYQQPFFRILPLYITLGVAALQSKGNRLASLIGGCNAVLYAIIYFVMKLYATAAYWLLIAVPIQLITYVRWGRRAYKNTTELKKMTWKQRGITAIVFAVAYVIVYLFISQSDSNHKFLDVASSLTGVFSMLIMMISYIDYTFFWTTCGIISIILNALMVKQLPGQMTFVVNNIYITICAIRGWINLRKLYREQQAVRLENSAEETK